MKLGKIELNMRHFIHDPINRLMQRRKNGEGIYLVREIWCVNLLKETVNLGSNGEKK
jgi:hypothetical protein